MSKREPSVRELLAELRAELRQQFAEIRQRLDALEVAAQKPRVARVVMPEATTIAQCVIEAHERGLTVAAVH